jgi:sugar phosphate permease
MILAADYITRLVGSHFQMTGASALGIPSIKKWLSDHLKGTALGLQQTHKRVAGMFLWLLVKMCLKSIYMWQNLILKAVFIVT